MQTSASVYVSAMVKYIARKQVCIITILYLNASENRDVGTGARGIQEVIVHIAVSIDDSVVVVTWREVAGDWLNVVSLAAKKKTKKRVINNLSSL